MKKNQKSRINPLVSVALTTFNGGDYLRTQLDSLLDQTYKNFEIVISDDGSNAETIAVLNEFANRDSRVRWSRSPYERGLVMNTQNAILLCNGEIIFLCDQDDSWYKDKLQLHVNAYADPEVMWVYNKLVMVNDSGEELGYLEDSIKDYYTKERMKLLYYTWGSCIGGAMTSYRSSIFTQSYAHRKICPCP